MLDRILIGSSAEPSDPDFENVTLLLHGDGSNGAQNNTFLDSSTNNLTITRNGNTTQGSFSPYGSNWSNYFDGSGDYLTAASNAAYSFGTGDFTIEAWIYVTNYASTCAIFDTRTSGNEASGVIFYVRADGKIELYRSAAVVTASTALSQNSWNHVAVTRSGSTCTLWLNGVSVGTATDSTNLTQQNSFIGAAYTGSANMMVGYISNLRVVKGTAVYTSAFTPSTTPLTAITNTSLLTCQSNRFRDASTNNFTITRNGDVKVTNFAPFAPSSAYSTSANGGSAYFDGSGDYLDTPSSSNLGLATSDFTIEGWIYPTGVSGSDSVIFDFRNGTGGNNGPLLIIGAGGGNPLVYVAAGSAQITGSGVTLNSWSHFAVTRSGTSTKLFLNGVQTGSTYTDTNNYTSPTRVRIGADDDGSPNAYFIGYMSNVRVVKGTAVYTANFTPPASPVTAITNTSLLTNFTNGAIFDNSMKNDLETVGNAQISTSVKKFGTGSMAFDGSGDWLVAPDTDALGFGSGNFTAEAWVYFSSLANEAMIMGQWSGDTGSTTLSWALMLSSGSTGYLRLITSSDGSSVLFDLSTSSTSFTLSTGQWYHIAAVRNGSTFTIYVDGTSRASTTNSSALYNATNNFTIGAESNTQAQYLNGYIDDLRITKGIARYTANFTPPTAAFPNK